jgi:hypothetical protein
MSELDYNALQDILSQLENAEAAWPFLEPVDWKGMQLDDYPLIVQDPMDLSIVRVCFFLNMFMKIDILIRKN